MSIRNLSTESNIDINCNDVIANNVYSKRQEILISSAFNDFDVLDNNPTAIFIRNGDYIICSGNVNIKMNQALDAILVDIKILNYDNPYNSISSDAQLIGGGGSGTVGDLSLNYLIYNTLSSVSVRYRFAGQTIPINSQWKLNYSFIYKQILF